MKEFAFSTFSDFTIVQACNFTKSTKNDLSRSYFAKILTKITKQLFRRTRLDSYFFKKIKSKYATVY